MLSRGDGQKKHGLLTNTIHILGPGSIGLYFASVLALNAVPSILIFRTAEQANDFGVKGNSIRRTNLDGTIVTSTLHEADNMECSTIEPSSDSIDPKEEISILLVTTKAHQTVPALGLLLFGNHPRLCVTAKTCIVVVQNGAGASDYISTVHKGRSYQGLTYSGVYRSGEKEDPPSITYAGEGATKFAVLSHQSDNDDVPTFLNLLGSVVDSESLRLEIFRKLSINACINPVTAIFNLKNGQALTNLAALSTMRSIAQEVCEVYQKMEIPSSTFDEIWGNIISVLAATKANWSSMAQDVQAGRRTEIDFINGYIVNQGKEHGVQTPINESIVFRIHKCSVEE